MKSKIAQPNSFVVPEYEPAPSSVTVAFGRGAALRFVTLTASVPLVSLSEPAAGVRRLTSFTGVVCAGELTVELIFR